MQRDKSSDKVTLRMKLATRTKISLARGLLSGVTAARRLVGLTGTVVRCRRSRCHWELDISEGIDLAIYLFGRFEPATHRLLDRIVKPGMCVFDIGANIGAHTLGLALRVGGSGKVVAVEPTEWAFAKLQKNLALNPELTSRVVTVHGAVLASSAEQVPMPAFYSSWSLTEDAGQESFHPVLGGFLRSAGEARSFTLDELMQFTRSKPDIIKIDVDGYELDVLGGGVAILREVRPRLVLEMCPYLFTERGRSLEELLQILRSVNYRIYTEQGTVLPLETSALTALIPIGGGINVLALPPDQSVVFPG
jgi:FkbM family methyltransferase